MLIVAAFYNDNIAGSLQCGVAHFRKGCPEGNNVPNFSGFHFLCKLADVEQAHTSFTQFKVGFVNIAAYPVILFTI